MANIPTPHSYLRVRDAARYLAISPRSLADPSFRKRHNIPTLRLGRAVLFDKDQLTSWLKNYQKTLRQNSNEPSEGNHG